MLGDGPALAAEAIRRVAVAAEGAEGIVAGDLRRAAAATRSRFRARSGQQLPREGEQGARALGEPALLVDCSDLPAPGDADTPADLPLGR